VHISQIPGHRLRDSQQMLRVGEVVSVWVLNVDQQQGKISLTMHKPRHLQEGRAPTIGERLDQQQGRRRPRGDRNERRDEGAPAGGPGGGPGTGNRFAGSGRVGERRPPRAPGEEGNDRPRFGRGGPRGGDRDDRGDRGFGDRGPRGRGPREQRVYTVEPAREAAETRTHKGEFTSLSNLRALLGKGGNKPASEKPTHDGGDAKQ
jgi:hypothetical protein